MKNILNSKDKLLCVVSVIIVIGAYASEKLVEVFVQPSAKVGVALAMVYTIAVAVVFFMGLKNKNPFFGLLASLIGYKMLPPKIPFLQSQMPEADLLYFIVGKAAVVLFVILIIKFYSIQEKPRAIKPLPILAIMFCVVFTNGITARLSEYFTAKTGSLMSAYFIGFALYAVANIVILVIAYQSGHDSMRFTAYFEFTALGINILRKCSAITVLMLRSSHISKSLYCWLAVYIALIILAYLLKEKSKKRV